MSCWPKMTRHKKRPTHNGSVDGSKAKRAGREKTPKSSEAPAQARPLGFWQSPIALSRCRDYRLALVYFLCWSWCHDSSYFATSFGVKYPALLPGINCYVNICNPLGAASVASVKRPPPVREKTPNHFAAACNSGNPMPASIT